MFRTLAFISEVHADSAAPPRTAAPGCLFRKPHKTNYAALKPGIMPYDISMAPGDPGRADAEVEVLNIFGMYSV